MGYESLWSRVFVSCIKRCIALHSLLLDEHPQLNRVFPASQMKQSFLTQIDNVLSPEGGVTVEADGPVGSGDGIAACLQDVPQLERYLRETKTLCC